MLVDKYKKTNCEDKTILGTINKSIDASMSLRSKKYLINQFVNQLNTMVDVETDWHEFVEQKKQEELQDLIDAENLKPDETKNFVTDAFRDGVLKTTGTSIDDILPKMSRFGNKNNSNRADKKKAVIDKLHQFFEKYTN